MISFEEEVALELARPEFEGVTDSESEEDEPEHQVFGAHIIIEDLSGKHIFLILENIPIIQRQNEAPLRSCSICGVSLGKVSCVYQVCFLP